MTEPKRSIFEATLLVEVQFEVDEAHASRLMDGSGWKVTVEANDWQGLPIITAGSIKVQRAIEFKR